MNQLKGYTGKQLQNALHLLKQYHSASNEEVLHQLRVSLKKLKAVLDYLLILHPKKIKPLRKKLQIVFHAAGDLREAQLRLLWLKEKQFQYLITDISFDKKIKEEEEQFAIQKDDYLKLLSTVENEIDKYLKKIKEGDLLDYALELKQKLEQQLLLIIQKDWHVLRKLIKQLLYAHHWLAEKDKLKVLTVTAFQRMDGMQEKIGLWHDAVDLLQWLTDGQFFLSKDKAVKQQFNKAFTLVKKDIEVKEKAVLKQLQEIKKAVNKK
jgi:CHAD domain-containing protein